MITPEQLAECGTEEGMQSALFCWAALNFNTYPELRRMFAIPNGGWRDKITAGKLKAAGVKAGVPDICLPVPRNTTSIFSSVLENSYGLWIELKRPKSNNKQAGNPTSEQLDWIGYLNAQGYKAVICYGWEQARDEIIKYLEG